MYITLFSLGTDSVQVKALIFILSFSLISMAFNVIDFYFQSVSKNKFPAQSKIISQIIISIFKIFCIIKSASVSTFILILLLDSLIISAAFAAFFIKEGGSILLWKFDRQLAKNMLIDSWPLIFSGISIALYMRIDQMMINQYLGLESLGQYSVALRISEAWYFIPQLLGVVLSPALFRAKEKDEKLYYEKIQSLFTLMVWLSIVVAIITSSLATSIIPIIFGPDFQQAGKVLQIHIWSGIFLSLGIASGRWFLAENHTLGALYKSLLGLFVNIIGNLILIPMYGINGAAFSTLIAHFSANVLYDFFDNKARVQLKYKFRAFFPLYLLNDKKRY
jgi:O-antigen/teichoic acid export membrane protein